MSGDQSAGTAPADRVIWSLRRAFLAVEALKEARLKRLRLSNAQYGVLMNVFVAPGLTGAELARRLGVSPQNITTLVARAEERGWVERRAHPLHHHVRELHLTEEGASLLKAAETEVAALEEDLRACLGESHSEQVRDALNKLASLKVDNQPG
ncbi:MarR family winged helix-turn-helix transcriptional regulator [Nocardioides rubriscoriae]|uniref:MarR family winged helix-turn-helix transcriptional regulator n=1 Tax=Nocardioides rubriscoriae TaxID=642762 RepID=UPI0011DF9D33|nr:MarR family transcriptional regulator [Nocardioides rubriscoriae]